MTLDGKVVLVTGASRGIGSAIATKLGESGATVIGTATTIEGAESINERFQKIGIKGEGMQFNVTDTASIDNLLSNIEQKYGHPSILINNAAVTRDNLFLRMKEDEWNDVLNTNLTGIFYLTKACLRPMLKSKWGRIISIGSVVGTTGNPGQTNYSAAKAAVVGFSKSLAQEVASRNITVNVIAPGFIDTDMTKDLPEDHKAHLLSKIPAQRLGHAVEVASVASFLASDEAAYITGQTIHVNGGMYMV